MDNYTGYTYLELSEEELANFYEGGTQLIENPIENHYYLLNLYGKTVDRQVYESGEFHKVKYAPFDTIYLGKVKPLNEIQELGFHMLQNSPSTVKIFDSDYGVGKSFLCANYVLDCLSKEKFSKVILIRPNIGLEDYPSLGSIPGDYLQKSLPWFAMLCDIVGSPDIIIKLIEQNKLELAPMETLRGRSFSNSIVYVEECGNLTPAACRLIVSRVGEGSQLLMCGDQSQVDKKKFKENNGLKVMRDALVGDPLVSYLKLKGCVRSATAQLCEKF